MLLLPGTVIEYPEEKEQLEGGRAFGAVTVHHRQEATAADAWAGLCVCWGGGVLHIATIARNRKQRVLVCVRPAPSLPFHVCL